MPYEKRLLGAFVVVILLAASPAFADNFIYRSTNKIDFIKLDKAKKGEKEGGLKHPFNFDPEQIRTILRSIHFNKKALLAKNIQDQQLYSEGNAEFLAPYLMEAFKKATPAQVVAVSYFTLEGKTVVQNDRLTVFRAFVKEDGLHIVFHKLYAKLFGDRTTMGSARMASEARSLRVGLEVGPGQNRIAWDPEELVLDLTDFGPGGVKTAGMTKKSEQGRANAAKGEEREAKGGKTIKERLKELDQLKKDELITEKEYKRKRQELLDQL